MDEEATADGTATVDESRAGSEERQDAPPDRRETVVVGLLATPGLPAELADEIAEELPAALEERFPQVAWRVETADEPLPAISGNSTELVQEVRRARLEEGWQLAICLTDLPLRAGRRPVTAHASPTHGVGLISVPAFGAVALDERVRDAVVRLVGGLLMENTAQDGEEARVPRRLSELASPLGRPRVKDTGTVRFVSATVRGNLRLLVGMVRANRPTRVIVRLSRALASTLGTAALALTTISIWQIADGLSAPRLMGLTVASAGTTVLALILAHDLWEHSRSDEEREQVVLFNLVTTVTLVIGVVSLYVVLLAATALAGGALIPSGVLERNLSHPADIEVYLKLAWLVSSLATIGGALGSVVESNLTVREAAYRYHSDDGIEEDETAKPDGAP